MAIEIKEYVDATFTECQVHNDAKSNLSINLKESTQYSNRVAPNSLNVEIEGLHSVITRNYTKYTDHAMKMSEKYWTSPYERPVIMHHNESDGITIGRVKNAYWTDVNTRSNTGALRFNTNIAHKDGIEGVNNGTLSTVSVGLIANDVTCSICGKQVELDEDNFPECGHMRGSMVDDKLCYWIINEFEPKELSFVIVPSDPFAHILSVEKVTNNSTNNNKEVKEMHSNSFGSLMEEANENVRDIEIAESAKNEEKKKTATKKEEEKQEEKESEEKTEEGEKSDNIDNDSSDEAKEQEGEKEDDSKEKEEESSSEEQGHSESESNEIEDKESKEKESEEKKEEETPEDNKPKGKVIEEDFEKDIDSKKDDIYKDIEMQKKLHEKDLKAKEQDQEIKELKKKVEELSNKLNSEVKLKESIENELIQFKTEKKKQLAEQVNSLRKNINFEPEDVNHLMESSEETLHFTIKTLKEFNSHASILNSIPKTKSEVAVSENKDNTQKTSNINVKESNKDSNINVEESIIEDILNNAFGSNNRNFF